MTTKEFSQKEFKKTWYWLETLNSGFKLRLINPRLCPNCKTIHYGFVNPMKNSQGFWGYCECETYILVEFRKELE